jgi:flagellar protein FliO/FliZ
MKSLRLPCLPCHRCILPALLCIAGSAHADTQAAPASSGSLLQVLLGLVVVLGLMAALAWMLRRMGMAKTTSAGTVKIIGGVNVGSRERILVVEVADQWIVVGVAPGRVNTLATMPRQEGIAPQDAVSAPPNFAAWLKQKIEKRNGQ